MGYNPYLTNLFKYGHPFYPLAGQNAVDIMTVNTPQNMVGKNSLQKAFYSYFGLQMYYLDPVGFYWNTSPNIILERLNSHFNSLYFPDIRVRGFGLASPFVIVFTLISSIGLWLSLKKNPNRWKYLFVVGVVLLSVAVNPEFWWARYIPQFWFLTALNCVLLIWGDPSPHPVSWVRSGLRVGCLLIIILNSGLIALVSLKTNTTSAALYHSTYTTLFEQSRQVPVAVDFNGWYAVKAAFDDRHINYYEMQISGDYQKLLFTEARLKP